MQEQLTEVFTSLQQKGDSGSAGQCVMEGHKGTCEVDGTRVDWWECEWHDSASAMEDADVALVAFDLREMKTLSVVVANWRQQILPSHLALEGCLVLVGVHHGDWTQDGTQALTDTYTAGKVHEESLHQVLRLTASSSDSIFCVQVATALQAKAVVLIDVQSEYNMDELRLHTHAALKFLNVWVCRNQIMRVGTAHAKCESLPNWSPNVDEQMPEKLISKEDKHEGMCAECNLM